MLVYIYVKPGCYQIKPVIFLFDLCEYWIICSKDTVSVIGSNEENSLSLTKKKFQSGANKIKSQS